jgi:hypothetical protein
VLGRQAHVEDADGLPIVRPYPNSRPGRRVLPLPTEAVESLRDQRQRQIEEQLRATGATTAPP